MGIEETENKDNNLELETPEEVPEKVKTFNFPAFLFCSTYFIAVGHYLIGLVLFLLTAAVPMTYYFFIGLCCGFFSGGIRSRVSGGSIILSIFSVVVFVVLKLARLYFIGGM